MLQLSPLGR